MKVSTMGGTAMRYEHNLSAPKFTVHNIDTVNATRNKDYKYSYKNGRSKHGFVYITHGSLDECFLDKEYGEIPIRSGEVIFIPKDVRYIGYYREDNTEVKIVQFDISEGELPEYLRAPMKIDIPNLCEMIDAFFDPVRSNASRHPFYYLSNMYYLLWNIDEHYTKIPTKYKKLRPALYELSESYYKSEPISYYSELCQMSEANFRRVFREYTGMSPIEYRNDLRLSNAKAMLSSLQYNVTEAAEACGFSNLSFFIRLYKNKFGYTPKKE